jgi:3-vinyl bacteriochlorophyllide hydratase
MVTSSETPNRQSAVSAQNSNPSNALYTPEQRIKRDKTVWTLVQGILAPVQFLVFLVSLVLVLRYLYTGEGQEAAVISVVIKTLTLYTIMITGCIWEKVVFDCYLFAPAFYWEDVFSMLVLGLHTWYLAALFTNAMTAQQLMYLALAAYATYVVNAGQFIWKLRIARLDHAKQLAAVNANGAAA